MWIKWIEHIIVHIPPIKIWFMLTFPPTHCSLSDIRWTKRHAWVVKRYCADTREGTRYRARFIGNHLLRRRFTVSFVGIVVYAAFMCPYILYYVLVVGTGSFFSYILLSFHRYIKPSEVDNKMNFPCISLRDHRDCDCFDACLFGISNGSIVEIGVTFGQRLKRRQRKLVYPENRWSIIQSSDLVTTSMHMTAFTPLAVLPSTHIQDASDLAK